ncbi:FadR/GntR family transcriptional regulator [Streptomyces sp. NPDC059651]
MNGGRMSSPEDVAEELRRRIRTGELRPGASLPTQAVLAGEFGVARSVVRQALQRLQGDGLLTAVTRGAPPRVASLPEEEPASRPAALGPRLLSAFEHEDVRIDALCLTTESLLIALGESLRRIWQGDLRPSSVQVRVLLPGNDIELAFPRRTQPQGEDDVVHDRWLQMRDAFAQVLRANLQSLRTHGISVDVALRELPFTPPVKLYMLNGREALFAYYTVQVREELIEDRPVEIFDALGLHSALFSFESSAGVRDQQFVEQSARWFQALWDTVATPLVPEA